MTPEERARLEVLNTKHVMEHAEHQERDRLRALDELDRLGPDAVAAKQRAQEARIAAYKAARADYERRAAATTEALRRMRPSWAQACIVAERAAETAIDPQTFTHRRYVALAWSRHTRDLFPELRAAALRFPETAHLGSGQGEIEHREKYTGGGGYFLQDEMREDWRVRKHTLTWLERYPEVIELEWLTSTVDASDRGVSTC